MFDSNAAIEIDPPSRPGQKFKVRWPTDAEWYARTRARRIISRRLGRGRSETVLPEPGEADTKLYEAIALNGAPPVSAAEASMYLESMSVANISDVRIEDGIVVVELQTMSGEVEHRLKIPTAEQIIKWRRSAVRVIDLPHNQQEVRINPEAGAALWDQCEGTSKDYAAMIPGPHKDVVARALVDFIDQNLGPRQDDANF